MTSIPLCVPFARKDEARQAGARWNPDERVWRCDARMLGTGAYAQLRPFVPRMYRPERSPPFLRPWMVPQPLWGKNLRALLPKEQWDVVRRHAYEQAGHRCRVCGGRGPQWPVEADEAWAYDDAHRTQTLKGVIALCPDCHHVRHWGKSMVEGREEDCTRHLKMVNRWTRSDVERAVAAALAQWEERSRHEWRSDCGWVTRVHGFTPDEAGTMRAEAANKDLVSLAQRRAESAEHEVIPARPGPTAYEPDAGLPPAPRRERTVAGLLRRLFR